jgi:hypothetical protein
MLFQSTGGVPCHFCGNCTFQDNCNIYYLPDVLSASLVLFPLMIMLLVPVRQYILPKFFKAAHLQDLDAADYEEAPALSFNIATVSFLVLLLLPVDPLFTYLERVIQKKT